jgi:hypothetical protein
VFGVEHLQQEDHIGEQHLPNTVSAGRSRSLAVQNTHLLPGGPELRLLLCSW